MKRFAGMMPHEEIKKEKHYKCEDGTIIAQAGPNGWTVIWADNGTNYKDNVATTEENFQTALTVIEHYFPGLTGNDFDGRAEADAKLKKLKEVYSDCVDQIISRISRDLHVILSMYNEYPSREEYFRRKNEEHLTLPYEDREVLTSRKYNRIRDMILEMDKEEFLSKLREKFLDTSNRIKDFEELCEKFKDKIRFYDALPCSMAIKLGFSDGRSVLYSIYSNLESMLRDYTEYLDREMQFKTKIQFKIDNGYHRYKVREKTDPESFHAVRFQIETEIKEYFTNEIIPKLVEKYNVKEDDILRSSMVFTESEYGSERIIYPDGSTEEDD